MLTEIYNEKVYDLARRCDRKLPHGLQVTSVVVKVGVVILCVHARVCVR